MTTNQSEQFQQQQEEEEETEELNLNKKIFKFDRSYQEKIVQSMVMDQPWASQFLEVLELDYFGYAYLKLVASCYVDYYKEYKEFPSQELLLTIIKDKLKASSDAILTEQVKGLLKRIASNKDLGDLIFVKSQSLSWCKKMALTKALDKSITYAENEDDHEKIVTVIQKAITAGNSHTSGLDLLDDIDARYSETYRQTIPTGIKELDQRKILNGGLGAGELGIVVAPTGCHAKGSKLFMFDGTLKVVEDILPGEKLLGPDGTERTVLRLIRGNEEMYEIVPTKGKPFVVNKGHILSLVRTNDGTSLSNKVVEITVEDYLKSSKTYKHIHKLYRPSSMVFRKASKKLSIEPYMLGLLLGDGYLTEGRVEITTADNEIVSEIKNFAKREGLELSRHHKKDNTASGWYFTNHGKHNNPLTSKLRNLGLIGKKSHDKFVPREYKFASIQDRQEILAGLIDSDGYLHNNTYEFVSKSPELAGDVKFIAQSLGLAAYTNQKFVNGDEYTRVSISGETAQIPSRLSRKLSSKRNQIKSVLHTGFSIREVASNDYYGFTVDKDNLYLNDDFIVIHNCGKSHMLVHVGAQAILQGKNVAHYTFELNERNMGIRYDSHILGINSTDCFEHKDVIKKFYKENEDTLGTLRIKYYSSAVASVMTLRAHLQKLATTGFRPDMVLVDYAGIMRSADRNDLLRIELKKVCEELRAFADELQVPVWTALQSNKEGASSEVVDLTNMAESYAQAHVADFVVGLSRQSSQKSKGFGNIFIAKNRAGMDGIKYPIHLDTARSFLKVLTADEVGDFLGDIEDEKKDDAVSIVRRTYRDQVNNTKIKH